LKACKQLEALAASSRWGEHAFGVKCLSFRAFSSQTTLEKLHMMSIIGTIVIGFIVGLIARAVKPGDDKLGLIMTAVLGVAGSFLASYAGAALGLYKQGDVASVVGAIILLIIYSLVTKTSGGGGDGPAA
jgi:uncharacterized membrane protein YeaQ/YmgE (transglycosylase-associated protein family)